MEGTEIIAMVWQRLAHVPEPDMQLRRFLDYLRRLDDADAAHALNALYLGALRKDPACLGLLPAFGDRLLLAEHFDNDRLAAVFSAADAAELPFAAELLAPSSLPRQARRALEGDRDLSTLTLGEKKTLARSCVPRLIEKLLVEPEPSVIRHLLDHPRLLERDVLLIASRRPTLPEILEEIWRNRRWRQRYEVRRALASNPYTPQRLARVILPFLSLPDLQELRHMRLYPRRVLDEVLRALDPDAPLETEGLDDDAGPLGEPDAE